MSVAAKMIRRIIGDKAKMEHDAEWLRNFIQKRTKEVWDKSQKPYYLSFIAVDLAKSNIDYKPIIAPLRLRQWATVNEVAGTKLVIHSKHKAKVGYIPENVEYSFDDEDLMEKPETAVVSKKSHHREVDRRPLFNLLESLSKLSDKELEAIHIPVKIFVRLFKN